MATGTKKSEAKKLFKKLTRDMQRKRPEPQPKPTKQKDPNADLQGPLKPSPRRFLGG